MKSLVTICAFVLFAFSSVYSIDICDFNDLVCISNAAKNVYKMLLIGKEGFKPIEPLILDNISGKFKTSYPGLKYVLTNATLFPMKNCEPSMTYFNESSYVYVLECSQLTLQANVIAKGRLGPIEVDGRDLVTITADHYTITAKGPLRVITSNNLSQSFMLLKTNFTVDAKSKGNLTFQTITNFGLTKEQALLAKDYFRNNWQYLEKSFRYPTMTEIISEIIFNRIDPYLRVTPMEKVIPKEHAGSEIA